MKQQANSIFYFFGNYPDVRVLCNIFLAYELLKVSMIRRLLLVLFFITMNPFCCFSLIAQEDPGNWEQLNGLLNPGLEYPKHWDIMMGPEYTKCQLSLSGKYIAVERYVGIAEKRAYIFDLEKGTMILAGPADVAGRTNMVNSVYACRWNQRDELFVLSRRGASLIDPSDGSEIKHVKVKMDDVVLSQLSLPDSLDEPIIIANNRWERGQKGFIRQITPSEGDVKSYDVYPTYWGLRRIIEGSAGLTYLINKNPYRSGFKFKRSSNADFETIEFELPLGWSFYPGKLKDLASEDCFLLFRKAPQKTGKVEMRLFDFTRSEFLGATVTLELDEAANLSNLVSELSVDRMRALGGVVLLAEIEDESVAKLYRATRKLVPNGIINVYPSSNNSSRTLVSISSLNRPNAWYLYDAEKVKMMQFLRAMPVLEKYKSLEVSSLSLENYPFAKPIKISQRLDEAKSEGNMDTLVRIRWQPIFDLNMPYDPKVQFLVEKGFPIVDITLPNSLFFPLLQGESQEAIVTANNQIRDYINEVFDELYNINERDVGKVHILIEGLAASALGALEDLNISNLGSLIIKNPLLMAGLKDVDALRLSSVYDMLDEAEFNSDDWLSLNDSLAISPFEKAMILIRSSPGYKNVPDLNDKDILGVSEFIQNINTNKSEFTYKNSYKAVLKCLKQDELDVVVNRLRKNVMAAVRPEVFKLSEVTKIEAFLKDGSYESSYVDSLHRDYKN